MTTRSKRATSDRRHLIVTRPQLLDPPPVAPARLLHQEGVLGLIAVAGLAFRPGGPVAGLAPSSSWMTAVGAAVVASVAGSGLLWLVRGLPPMRDLERFQGRLVRHWTAADAVSVGILSGLAEEALLRALLQPLIGLIPAALLFAVLHIVPDRRLWLWPVVAFGFGVVLGVLFEVGGYPAAALAHLLVNLGALLRLRRIEVED